MTMKITMMGCSGTGKTCYLYGTYARMLDGISGFNFNPADWNQGLLLEESWYSLFESDARWPRGSTLSEEYNFDVFYEGQKLGGFTWLDYRGEILNSQTETDSEGDVNQFYKRCSGSDTLIVCVPADVLMNACSEKFNIRTMADRMLNRYKSILLHLPNRAQTPVVLMITKGDLMTKRDVFRNGIAKLKEKFDFLFTQNHEAVMIVRTRLGKFRGDMSQGGLIEGEFDPQFIHLPILFPLYLDFSRQAASLRNAGDNWRERGGTIWGKFFYGDRSAQFYLKADEMQRNADVLWKVFVGAVDIYQRGERIINSSGVQ